ncbi:Squalene--hopene cyclase [Minicystis rosea]|nr:Squalene--hopene cyclase [Minicystis rosea]
MTSILSSSSASISIGRRRLQAGSEHASPQAALERALRAGVAHLAARRGPDGLWREACLAGPMHAAMGLVATLLLGDPSPARLAIESRLVRDLIAAQTPSGGFVTYPGSDPGRDATRLVRMALELFRERHADTPALDDALARSIEATIQAADAYLTTGARGGGFYAVMADLFTDTVHPDRSRALPSLPFTAEAARAILESPRFGRMLGCVSTFAEQAMPAMTILFAKAAQRSRFEAALRRLAPASAERALHALEERILAQQDPSGSWLWTVMGTALNLLALRAMGRGADDPAIQRGVAFIDRLRMPGPDGAIRQSWCNAENWDAALGCDALLAAGVAPEEARLDAIVDHLVREQRPDGLWAYGAGSRRGDNDTGAFVAAFLVRVAPRLTGSRRASVAAALAASTASLLRAQQPDGGWGFSPAPARAPYSFGRRVPFAVEANTIDASTPDVSSRVLMALVSARDSGLLGAETRAPIDAAVARAIAFLRACQSPNGSFWSRWRPGYVAPLAFILPALRAAGQDMRARWMQDARAFLLRHQNADGGFGDTMMADEDPALAGRGSSTPLHTASALLALTALGGDDAEDREARAAAVAYLVDQQANGTWHNGRACFTAAFREDYWDAPFGTHALVTRALAEASR